MEKLRTYLQQQRLRQRDFALQAKLSDAHLSRILRGERMPGLATAIRIMNATGGLVRPEDWQQARTE